MWNHAMNRSEEIRFDAVVDRIPDDTDRVLDVGCARHEEAKRQSGNLHAYLHAKTDAEIVGIDVLEDEIEKMRSEGYDVHVGDAEKIQFDDPFDVVVAGEVIEHLANPARFVNSAVNAVATDGKVVLTTPNPNGFAYFRKALFDQSNNPTHTCWIDPTNLQTLVSIVDVDVSVTEWRYLPPVGGISMLLWRGGFRRAAAPGYVAEIERMSDTSDTGSSAEPLAGSKRTTPT